MKDDAVLCCGRAPSVRLPVNADSERTLYWPRRFDKGQAQGASQPDWTLHPHVQFILYHSLIHVGSSKYMLTSFQSLVDEQVGYSILSHTFQALCPVID